jgi:hypothetical protein
MLLLDQLYVPAELVVDLEPHLFFLPQQIEGFQAQLPQLHMVVLGHLHVSLHHLKNSTSALARAVHLASADLELIADLVRPLVPELLDLKQKLNNFLHVCVVLERWSEAGLLNVLVEHHRDESLQVPLLQILRQSLPLQLLLDGLMHWQVSQTVLECSQHVGAQFGHKAVNQLVCQRFKLICQRLWVL